MVGRKGHWVGLDREDHAVDESKESAGQGLVAVRDQAHPLEVGVAKRVTISFQATSIHFFLTCKL